MIAKAATALVLVAMCSPAFAKPELSTPLLAVGTVQTASEGTYVMRSGKLVAARSGQALFPGDKVITRGQARAKVAMKGCTVSLQPTSILPIGTSCGEAQSFAGQAGGGGALGGGLGGGGGLSTAATIGIGLGVAGAIGGAVAISTSGSPASP